MKKIFSTVAMAIVAFTAVVTMSSCQNDDPSSFNAAPQVPQTTQTTNNNNNTAVDKSKDYSYQACLSNDVFDYFDVVLTCTDGSNSKTYTFTNATDMDGVAGMQTVKDSFKSDATVTFQATVTPKANWKEIFDSKGGVLPCFRVGVNYVFQGYPYNKAPNGNQVTKMNDDIMAAAAKFLAAKMTVTKA